MNFTKLFATCYCCLFFSVCGAQTASDASTAPVFSRYPAEVKVIKTPPSQLRLTTAQSQRFRTVIDGASKEKPNFAGHFRIATWGCGTDCRGFAIIDLLSGQVSTADGIETITGALDNDDPRLDFRADSQLLVISGQINEDPKSEARHLFRWNGKKLVPIGRQPLPRTQF